MNPNIERLALQMIRTGREFIETGSEDTRKRFGSLAEYNQATARLREALCDPPAVVSYLQDLGKRHNAIAAGEIKVRGVRQKTTW
ncbi:MAG: hypothetical protein WC841_04680 [Candidatus Shapirobacteria bacterium]|jgi:hypothetical protein